MTQQGFVLCTRIIGGGRGLSVSQSVSTISGYVYQVRTCHDGVVG